jgi:RNA polymerase sigma-70 factor (ECF subfamily)
MRRAGELGRKLGIPEHQAEEALQESLARLWQKRASVEPGRWEGWLWNAMQFRVLVYFRARRRAGKYQADLGRLLERWQESARPEDVAHQAACDRELRALVDALAPPRREVVQLYLLEDVPMDEVAARLGISENTAKDRWRLAQIDMRAAWKRARAAERRALAVAALRRSP